MSTRFLDDGRTLWSFLDRILVECPRCGACGVVSGSWQEGRATFRCTGCGKSDESSAASITSRPHRSLARRRCPRCGRWLERAVHLGPGESREVHFSCACGVASSVHATAPWAVLGEPRDPFFGHALWLRARVGSDELWAYDSAHLALLEAYVDADLRERVGTRNGSMASRLPRWVKAAKNRQRVQVALRRMRERLATG